MKRYHTLTKILTCSIVAIGMFIISSGNSANASAVNNYIFRHNIQPVQINESIWNQFPKNNYRNGKAKPEGIVIHSTGNPRANINNEITYMKNNYRNAFVHTFIDPNQIINIANTDYLSWGVGYPGNARYIQFEQVEVRGKKAFAKQIANSAYYTAAMLDKYDIKPSNASYTGRGTVWSHNAVGKYLGGSNHTDPIGYYNYSGRKYFNAKYTMHQFYKLVVHYYDDIQDNKYQTQDNNEQYESSENNESTNNQSTPSINNEFDNSNSTSVSNLKK